MQKIHIASTCIETNCLSMLNAIRSRIQKLSGRQEKETLKKFSEMVKEIYEQEVEDDFQVDEKDAEDIINVLFVNCGPDFQLSSDE